MLPTLYTWGPVVQKLMEGAGKLAFKWLSLTQVLIPLSKDLMIPGLVYGPEGTLPQVNQGDLVAISIRGYK